MGGIAFVALLIWLCGIVLWAIFKFLKWVVKKIIYFFGTRSIKNKQLLQVAVDYVEGKIDINAFNKEYNNNKELVIFLKKQMVNEIGYFEGCYNVHAFLGRFLSRQNVGVFSKFWVWLCLESLLNYYKIPYTPYLKYCEDNAFLLDILPSWLSCTNDNDVYAKVIEETPTDLAETKRFILGRQKIKELFKYDKTYPRWIHEPEWPIINGKPLVFSHQKGFNAEDGEVLYYFYDPETKEETIVTQSA